MKFFLVLAAIFLSAIIAQASAVTYWAAPAAAGTGDGSSSPNAAYYLNSGFWTTVQSRLQTTNVDVNLLNGTYTGTLNLTNLGNPLHQLAIQAASPYGPVFSTTGNDMIGVLGSQNIKFYGIVFTGPAAYWGVNCQPNYLRPCRNLEFSYCRFINLTNVYYGAIGLLNGTRDVLVDSCTFSNLTANNGNHQHMIYASHEIVGVIATNCLFQDCLADYVRFRDDSEYCAVENCSFISTKSASAWPFISAELFNVTNSDSAGDEFFGTYFQVSGNSFTYNAGSGPGPYSALHFSDSGYSPQSYDCDLTSLQASQLTSGTTSFKRSFLQTNMGIDASAIKMFGNTYNSRVAHYVDYTYNWDGIQPNGGWSGTIEISSVPDSSGAPLGPAPALRNGDFDRQGLLLTPVSQGLKDYQCLFRTWFCNPKYANILRHPGLNGTSNALMFDNAANQYVYQWMTLPGPTWTMDCLIAIGSGFTGTGTKFKVDIFHDDISGSKVSVGVDNIGRFGMYSGGTFVALPELGTLAFSVDNNGNGYYNDPGDLLNVYHLRIVGNYSATTPYVDVYTSDANSLELSHQSLGHTSWVGAAPTSGISNPGTIAFYSYAAPVILDQVDVVGGAPPVISSASASGNSLILSGTNSVTSGTYYLMSSTNLALPQSSWTCEATNQFFGNSFSFTNPISPGSPEKFYLLQVK